MLASLPFGIVQHVLSFNDACTMSIVMCLGKDLRDTCSAILQQRQAIVYVPSPPPFLQYGPQLQQWLRHYPTTVTSLSLRECYFLTDEGCKLLAARFPLLESLDLSGCPVSSTGAKKFLKCESLTQFRCETSSTGSRKDMTINPAYIKALAGAKNLQLLSLVLGSKNKAGALSPLHTHTLLELDLHFTGTSDVCLDIRLPSLQVLRMDRGECSPQSWRNFFQTLCKSVSGGSGGSGGSSGGGPTPLCNLPNLQVLHIHSAATQLSHGDYFMSVESAARQLFRPQVLAVLPRSKLVSIVISPCTAAQLSQWQALGPRNILGQQISLTIGEKWFK